MAQRRRERNNNAVAEVVQSLMLPPHREKRISSFDHRGSTMPRLRPQLQSPGGNEKSTEPPALYVSPLLIWTFQTTRMRSVLGYGSQSHGMTRRWYWNYQHLCRRYRHHSSLSLFRNQCQGVLYRTNETRNKYTRRSIIIWEVCSKACCFRKTDFMYRSMVSGNSLAWSKI